MISPNTAPWTKVVCVVVPVIAISQDTLDVHLPMRLKLKEVYTVVSIQRIYGQFFAVLAEFPSNQVFSLRVFDYLVLPSCLTELLTARPIKEPDEVEHV